jgi:hypothetical protein
MGHFFEIKHGKSKKAAFLVIGGPVRSNYKVGGFLYLNSCEAGGQEGSGNGRRCSHIERVENELMDIAAELTALGDMIPAIIQNYEDMEAHTPQGIKLLLEGMRKRIEDVRRYIDSNFQWIETGKGG